MGKNYCVIVFLLERVMPICSFQVNRSCWWLDVRGGICSQVVCHIHCRGQIESGSPYACEYYVTVLFVKVAALCYVYVCTWRRARRHLSTSLWGLRLPLVAYIQRRQNADKTQDVTFCRHVSTLYVSFILFHFIFLIALGN